MMNNIHNYILEYEIILGNLIFEIIIIIRIDRIFQIKGSIN